MPARGFHAATKGPLKLAGRYAFLGRAKQVDSLKPQAKRQVAIFKDGAHTHGEGLTARVALPQARPGGLAVQPTDLAGVNVAAMRAHRSIRPKLGLNPFNGRVHNVAEHEKRIERSLP